jgi:hypothetical protein
MSKGIKVTKCRFCPYMVPRQYQDTIVGNPKIEYRCSKLYHKNWVINDIDKILDICPLPEVIFAEDKIL